MLNKITWGVIFILMLYTAFFGGRLYEAHKYVEVREQEQKDVLKKKIKKHGQGYHYLIEKGKLYMVKNVKDIENRERWIKI